MTIREFQKLIRDTYFHKDARRGLWGTFGWFVEEVGELAKALKKGEGVEEEFADTLAWLATLANLAGVDLEEAARKYEKGCPKCGNIPCTCGEPEGMLRPPPPEE